MTEGVEVSDPSVCSDCGHPLSERRRPPGTEFIRGSYGGTAETCRVDGCGCRLRRQVTFRSQVPVGRGRRVGRVIGFPGRSPGSSCMVCGADLWDVDRYVSAGAVVICDPCVDALKRAMDEAEGAGEVEVVRPARVYGTAPDDDAAAAIATAFSRTFGSREGPLDGFVEDAGELGPLLREGASRHGPASRFSVRVDAVRFPSPDLAEVRFQILMNGNPVGAFEGTAARRDGRWRVTRPTVARLLGTIGVNVRVPRRQSDGGA